MPKQPPSRPGIPLPGEEADPGSGRHRACNVSRVAIARVEQLAQVVDDHIDHDDDRLNALTRDVATTNSKIDAVNGHVTDLRVSVARMTTTLDGIGETIAEQNELQRVRVIAELETGKVEKIAAIEDAADRKKARRAFLLKVLLVIVAACGTTMGALIQHCR